MASALPSPRGSSASTSPANRAASSAPASGNSPPLPIDLKPA